MLLTTFECENIRCDLHPLMRDLGSRVIRQVQNLWRLYDKVDEEKARDIIWKRIVILMGLETD